MKYLAGIFCFLLCHSIAFSQFTVKGTVTNENNEAIDFASVFLKDSPYATSSIQDGSFRLTNVKPGRYTIKASYIGYESVEREIIVNDSLSIDLVLGGDIFQLNEINIEATRATTDDPIPYATIEREEIQSRNIAQDVPYMLRWMPSVTVTSDAGTGIGYTGVRVRGSEATRTNVTINGVPLNDSESQNVFWVDLPDFLANVEDIQVQRGVGVSTNGTSAFGATVHLNTQKTRQNSFAILSSALGSFNTNKASVHLGTGLLNNKFSIEGRYSIINSDGYVDRASANLNSYFFSASRVDEGSSLTLNVFSGGEVTYQAWNGLPYQFLETNRTFNTAGTETFEDPYNQQEGEVAYENEIDNYRQNHVQLIYNKALTSDVTLNVTAHGTQGEGYFENYKADKFGPDFNIPDSLTQDIVIQRWLSNLFYGGIFSMEVKKDRFNFILGGGLSQYVGLHYGDVIWRETVMSEEQFSIRYYTNDAIKREGNIYGRLNLNLGMFHPFVDLQLRAFNYTLSGLDDDGIDVDLTDGEVFFNPKVGASFVPSKNLKAFAFFGRTNREPGRAEYRAATNNTLPEHETLNDLELGLEWTNKYVDVNLTAYNMQYENQLVPVGQLNDVGAPIRTNIEDSYRRGIEIGLMGKITERISLGYFGTFSRNKAVEFTEFIDNWDTWGQEEVLHTNTDLALSPNQLHTIVSNFSLLPEASKHKLNAQVNYKYVGSQFLDNTSSEFAKLDAFSYMDAQISYETSFWKVKNVALTLQLNNLLNNEYVSNGWVYRYRTSFDNPAVDPYARYEGENTTQQNLTGLYPQALRNFLLGARIEF
jgi:iron complex outermembrane receptor protein